MDYRNTIEYLTSDIRELELLIGKFKDYSEIPAIELDLALSKLRNIYDILIIFKDIQGKKSVEELIPDVKKQDLTMQDNEAEAIQATRNEEEFLVKTESVTDQKQGEDTDAARMMSDLTEKEGEQAEAKKPDSRMAGNGSAIVSPAKSEESGVAPRKQSSGTISDKKKSLKEPVLGEQLQSNKSYIYEKLGSQTQKSDLIAKLQSSPINSISKSIGINDKFLFIRELFNGNFEEFNLTIGILDNAHNFNEAFNYLNEHFDWDMDSEAVQQLLNLIRRKFITRDNE